MQVDLLIIGGGPTALSAATAYRDTGGSGSVLLVSDEQDAPYFRPPLSKDYLRGDTGEDELPLQKLTAYRERDIDTRFGTAVAELDPHTRRATLAAGESLTYDQCVLATGAEPLMLPVPGADDPAVHTLRSLHSARDLRSAADKADTATVIGSGFIGCEAAVSLARRGLRVTMISAEEAPQHGRLGAELGARILGWLAEDRVEFIGGTSVTGIEEGRTVHRDHGGAPLRADLVVMATGVRPRTDLVSGCGVALRNDRVVVDERMRTEIPGLFAAGDVAFARNAAAGRHLVVEHWGEAENMGTVAGRTVAGDDARWDAVPGFWTTIGDHTLKYAAWGDGHDHATLVEHADVDEGSGAFTVWYSTDGTVVGVATHDADGDYERGAEIVLRSEPLPVTG